MKAPRTLVARLAWWFAGSLLTLYSIPAAIVYFYASAQARQNAVLTLKTEAEALAVYVAGSGTFDAPELREQEEAPIPLWLRVLKDGVVVAETPGTPRLPTLPEPAGGTPVVEVAFLPTRPAYAVFSHAIGGRTPGLRVEAIGSMEPLLRSNRRLATGLFLVGLVVIPLSALGGRALSQRALRPIGDLVEAIRGLDPGREVGKLELPDSVVEEVSVLSRAFNILLGRLEESVERMRRFTADASHEIRNPLSILRAGLEIGLRRERSGDEYRELLRENLQEIDRLGAVLEGVLLLARDVPGTELSLASVPVDLGEVVRATATFFADSAAEGGIRLETKIEPDLLVSGDAALLRLIVFNLIDNALKHSPQGEDLRVDVRREGDRAVLLVADRGPGVRLEDQERVFERFFQGGPASGSGVGGLGLSVVRWVTEAHGGTAQLLDTERGATFEVRLPVLV